MFQTLPKSPTMALQQSPWNLCWLAVTIILGVGKSPPPALPRLIHNRCDVDSVNKATWFPWKPRCHMLPPCWSKFWRFCKNCLLTICDHFVLVDLVKRRMLESGQANGVFQRIEQGYRHHVLWSDQHACWHFREWFLHWLLAAAATWLVCIANMPPFQQDVPTRSS